MISTRGRPGSSSMDSNAGYSCGSPFYGSYALCHASSQGVPSSDSAAISWGLRLSTCSLYFSMLNLLGDKEGFFADGAGKCFGEGFDAVFFIIGQAFGPGGHR